MMTYYIFICCFTKFIYKACFYINKEKTCGAVRNTAEVIVSSGDSKEYFVCMNKCPPILKRFFALASLQSNGEGNLGFNSIQFPIDPQVAPHDIPFLI